MHSLNFVGAYVRHRCVVEYCSCPFWRDIVFQIPIKQIVALGVDCGRINIDSAQYLGGVTPDPWSYQVLSKWLKDRKSHFLTSADTVHYSRVVTALACTARIQVQIDPRMSAVLADWKAEITQGRDEEMVENTSRAE